MNRLRAFLLAIAFSGAAAAVPVEGYSQWTKHNTQGFRYYVQNYLEVQHQNILAVIEGGHAHVAAPRTPRGLALAALFTALEANLPGVDARAGTPAAEIGRMTGLVDQLNTFDLSTQNQNSGDLLFYLQDKLSAPPVAIAVNDRRNHCQSALDRHYGANSPAIRSVSVRRFPGLNPTLLAARSIAHVNAQLVGGRNLSPANAEGNFRSFYQDDLCQLPRPAGPWANTAVATGAKAHRTFGALAPALFTTPLKLAYHNHFVREAAASSAVEGVVWDNANITVKELGFIEINPGGWNAAAAGGRLIYDYLHDRFFLSLNHYRAYACPGHACADFDSATHGAAQEKNSFLLLDET